MKPRQFIDDIFLFISNIELIFLQPVLALGSIAPHVICNGVLNADAELLEEVFDGEAIILIPPPKVDVRTRFVCFVQLKLSGSQPLQFVERVNVSFAYEAFDDPALSDMQPQSATYESEDTVTFQLSSNAIRSAVVLLEVCTSSLYHHFK